MRKQIKHNRVLRKDNTVCVSNDDVLNLYEKYPDVIISFFPTKQLSNNALKLIDKYADAGFKGRNLCKIIGR
jgi:hypothetical protein